MLLSPWKMIKASEPLRTDPAVLVLVENQYSVLGQDIGMILESSRFQYHIEIASGKGIPFQIHDNVGIKDCCINPYSPLLHLTKPSKLDKGLLRESDWTTFDGIFAGKEETRMKASDK
ncbi:Bifunctional heparan sulfate N-deacetylase/N-sulfotransferase 3, partial [Ophiophagus hannah]